VDADGVDEVEVLLEVVVDRIRVCERRGPQDEEVDLG
jgi:hypothetical protein